MRTQVLLIVLFLIIVGLAAAGSVLVTGQEESNSTKGVERKFWLLLLRKSNAEYLYKGIPGDKKESDLIRKFSVKTGIPGERPTPLPQLIGREYWIITKKYETKDNPETAPYFIELNVPGGDVAPFGPVPYEECGGPANSRGGGANKQCDWQVAGPFGLHGVNGDLSRLSSEDPGSSGCIRHKDEDIIYLYNLLNLNDEIRYYIEDK